MRIDAHLHFWQPSCGFDNRPVADHEAYRRDFLPEHVAPDLDASGVDRVILVQTCPQVEETDWLLRLCANDARVLGVTAWVDLDAPEVDFDALCAKAKVVGLRAQLRRIADPAFVERPTVVANLARALERGLNVTILSEARHYPHVARALDKLPDGPVTINHLGLPFPEVPRNAWRTAMRSFVERDNLFVQLSGLPFLYGERWRTPDADDLLDDAFDLVGAQRLMFASDWPMLVRFASYADWVRRVERLLDERSVSLHDRQAIFAGNALRANPRLRPGLSNVPRPPVSETPLSVSPESR
jgi:L-fuconolactonase